MSVTVRENILVNIKTTLEEISLAHGYANNFATGAIQRWKQQGNNKKDCPVVIISAGPETKDSGRSYNLTHCKMNVMLDLWVREAESSAADSEVAMNSLLGDIEKALMTDTSRGGYARDTKVLSVVPFETMEGEPMCGLIIEIELDYAHKLNDPYTKG